MKTVKGRIDSYKLIVNEIKYQNTNFGVLEDKMMANFGVLEDKMTENFNILEKKNIIENLEAQAKLLAKQENILDLIVDEMSSFKDFLVG